MVDISVIGQINSSTREAIKFCRSKKLVIEVVEDVSHAKGRFIALVSNDFYYEPYYLHYQWMALKYFKIGKVCDHFKFKLATIMVENPSGHIEFYCGDYTSESHFYRRVSLFPGKTFIEKRVHCCCTKLLLPELEHHVPDDYTLIKYHNYFK
jgi:hypothetical protein